jgi:hypothetical protein
MRTCPLYPAKRVRRGAHSLPGLYYLLSAVTGQDAEDRKLSGRANR